MPTGWCCWWPHPELPAGEVQGCASESRGEKLPHLLSAGGGGRGRPSPPAGLGERRQAVQLSKPGVYRLRMHGVEGNSATLAPPNRGSVPMCPPSMTETTGKQWKTPCKSSTSMTLTQTWVTPSHRQTVFCMFPPLTHSVQHLFGIVASVLHLGNVEFGSDSTDRALLENKTPLDWVANVRPEKQSLRPSLKGFMCRAYSRSTQLLGVDAFRLLEGLMCRKIEAHNDQVYLVKTIPKTIPLIKWALT